MEKDFFDLYENQSCLALELGHNSIADWCLVIHDIKGKPLGDRGNPCVSVQEASRELAFAKAYAGLCEYLSDARGGY